MGTSIICLPDTGKLISVRVVYAMNQSYDMISEKKLRLNVFLEEVFLEEIPLLTLSQLQPDGNTGEVYYVPLQGWQVGTYNFQAELYGTEGEGLIHSTQQEHIVVPPEAITQVVSWKTLGILIGAVFFSILVITGLIIYSKRDMLRASI